MVASAILTGLRLNGSSGPTTVRQDVPLRTRATSPSQRCEPRPSGLAGRKAIRDTSAVRAPRAEGSRAPGKQAPGRQRAVAAVLLQVQRTVVLA